MNIDWTDVAIRLTEKALDKGPRFVKETGLLAWYSGIANEHGFSVANAESLRLLRESNADVLRTLREAWADFVKQVWGPR